MRAFDEAVDKILEATVIGSFSKIGFDVRSRLGVWRDHPTMEGRTAIVTGATSGIGYETASQLLSLGARVRMVARDEDRARAACESLAARTGNTDIHFVLGDLSDLASVRTAAAHLSTDVEVLDVLVHNAGALSSTYRTNAEGIEVTLATQVLGPFVLTSLLMANLRRAAPGRVITVTSGGMYTQRFDLDRLTVASDTYDGVATYARVKRAQVVLNRQWARHVSRAQAVFHVMHPGWTDTPGVRSSLPRFHRVMSPLLRSPSQGADTIVWLAADPEATQTDGKLWLDRHRRTEHRVPWTTCRDADEIALWNWCAEQSGTSIPATG